MPLKFRFFTTLQIGLALIFLAVNPLGAGHNPADGASFEQKPKYKIASCVLLENLTLGLLPAKTITNDGVNGRLIN